MFRHEVAVTAADPQEAKVVQAAYDRYSDGERS
jgi:hypothetical protein